MAKFISLICWFAGLMATLVGAIHVQIHDASFVPDYSLHVTYEEAALACRYRWSALVNGSTPGPTLILQEGQTTWVRVYNDMTADNLTMHWHGLSQSVAQFSDGTPQASQWPIAPGYFFDYEVHPAVGEAGTYFYHSHVQFQAVSVAGPLIVREASGSPPYQYDDERIIFLTELFNRTDAQIVEGLTGLATASAWSGETEAVLVNGNSFSALPVNDTQTYMPWSYPPNSTVPSCQPEVFEVEPNKTYRFRSVGAVALSLVSFAFEDHANLTVIEVDGSYTQLAETDRIQIDSGQRFDFLLKTKTEAELRELNKTQFWVQLETRYRPTNVTNYAVLSYVNGSSGSAPIPATPPTNPPLTITNDIQDWLEYTLEPLSPNGFPSASEVTRTVFLRMSQIATSDSAYWTVNNHTWTESDEHLNDTALNATGPNIGTPYLVNIYEQGQAAIPDLANALAHGGRDPNLNVYVGEVGEVIDVILEGQPNGVTGGFDVHPWHAHGGHYYDIGSGQGSYNATANEERLKGYNPVLRDTTMLYKYTTGDGIGTLQPYTNHGWRAWRIKIEDPGVWMIHCHTLQHMIMGMQTVWVMGNASQITQYPEPYVQGYLQYGGSAYGNSTYDPSVMHAFD